jgi:hypothetical protein
MRTKSRIAVLVTTETQSPAVQDALIGTSELLKLAPPSLEMQGFPKRRQETARFDALRGSDGRGLSGQTPYT